MDPMNLLKRFRAKLAEAGIDWEASVPEQGFPVLLEFYRTERVEGVDLSADGDMLLFEWGVYKWVEDEELTDEWMFKLSLTRQVILEDRLDDEAIWQLHLAYGYTVTDELRDLGDDNEWCGSPADVADFLEMIVESEPYRAVKDQEPDGVALYYESVG